jgi:hypothetical protein
MLFCCPDQTLGLAEHCPQQRLWLCVGSVPQAVCLVGQHCCCVAVPAGQSPGMQRSCMCAGRCDPVPSKLLLPTPIVPRNWPYYVIGQVYAISCPAGRGQGDVAVLYCLLGWAAVVWDALQAPLQCNSTRVYNNQYISWAYKGTCGSLGSGVSPPSLAQRKRTCVISGHINHLPGLVQAKLCRCMNGSSERA